MSEENGLKIYCPNLIIMYLQLTKRSMIVRKKIAVNDSMIRVAVTTMIVVIFAVVMKERHALLYTRLC